MRNINFKGFPTVLYGDLCGILFCSVLYRINRVYRVYCLLWVYRYCKTPGTHTRTYMKQSKAKRSKYRNIEVEK